MKRFGIILAAGESSRMGTPKALLEYEGSTFIEALLQRFRRVTDDAVVVLGHNADQIGAALPKVKTVTNAGYRRGMLTSLQCGLNAAPSGTERYLFTLVDVPAVDASTFAAVAEAEGEIVMPLYRGRRGHPVAFSAQVAAELAALPVSATAKDVFQRDPARVHYVEVPDQEILNDIDTPEDYRELLQRKGAAIL